MLRNFVGTGRFADNVRVALILAVFVAEMRNPGLTVTFDSRGGTDVPARLAVK